MMRWYFRVARRLPLLRSFPMARYLLSAIALISIWTSGAAMGQSASVTEIATNGKLRSGSISIRVLGGVAEPLGKFIAMKLGVSYEPVMYPNPEAYVQSFGKGEWDIAIGPRVLAPPDKADSGVDLWLIDLVYVAAPGKSFADAGQVDRPGVKVGVIQGSPSDRFLSHNLKAAEIVRIPLSAEISADADELLRSGKADVFGATPELATQLPTACRAQKLCRERLMLFASRSRSRRDGHPKLKLKLQRSSARRSGSASWRGPSKPQASTAFTSLQTSPDRNIEPCLFMADSVAKLFLDH